MLVSIRTEDGQSFPTVSLAAASPERVGARRWDFRKSGTLERGLGLLTEVELFCQPLEVARTVTVSNVVFITSQTAS